MERYSHTMNVQGRAVVVQKRTNVMNARERMKAEIQAGSRSACTEYAARCSAQEALHGARRHLKSFGPVGSYRRTVDAKSFPSAAARASAVKVAQAAQAVETRTAELQSILEAESSAVTRIERAEAELLNAQRALEAALSGRVRDQAELPKFDARAGRVLDADERRLWDRTFPKTAGRSQ
jgi:hypothetical protein